MLKILYIEDNPADIVLVREMLAQELKEGYELETAGLLSEGLTRLKQGGIDLVLLDMSLPDAHGQEMIETVRKQATILPLIVLTGTIREEESAVAALRAGVQDYLVKEEINGRLLVRAIRYARERRIMDQLKDELLGIASHEVRSPMAVIQGAIGNLKDGVLGQLTEKQMGAVAVADNNIRRLTRLVENLLAISRFQAARGEPKKRSLDRGSLLFGWV